jgi:hypothetical protein
MLKWLRNRKQRRLQAAQQKEADAKQHFLRVREIEAQREQREREDRERDEQARNTQLWAERVGDSMQLQKLLDLPCMNARTADGQTVLRQLKAIKPVEEGFAMPPGNWPLQYLELFFVDLDEPIKDHVKIEGTLMLGVVDDDTAGLAINAYADLDDPLNTSRLHRNRQRQLVSDMRLLGERLNSHLFAHRWRITHIALRRNFEENKVSQIGSTAFHICAKDQTSYIVPIPVMPYGLFNNDTTAGD